MKRLLVATRNRGKQAEFRGLLAPLGCEILFPDDIGLSETAAEEALEVFATFEENARAKARYFAWMSGMPALADDSGVAVDALDGAPGVYSRRFAGLHGPDHEVAAANNAELLRRLADVPDAQRTAQYRGVLVLSEHDEALDEYHDVVASGETVGRILSTARGSGGFGYDPLFWSDELGASFGEVSQAAKDSVSHRARAVVAMVAALSAA